MPVLFHVSGATDVFICSPFLANECSPAQGSRKPGAPGFRHTPRGAATEAMQKPGAICFWSHLLREWLQQQRPNASGGQPLEPSAAAPAPPPPSRSPYRFSYCSPPGSRAASPSAAEAALARSHGAMPSAVSPARDRAALQRGRGCTPPRHVPKSRAMCEAARGSSNPSCRLRNPSRCSATRGLRTFTRSALHTRGPSLARV